MADLTRLPDDEGAEDYGSFYWCLECEWHGHVNECDIDYDWDEFKRIDVAYPICPECGGSVEC